MTSSTSSQFYGTPTHTSECLYFFQLFASVDTSVVVAAFCATIHAHCSMIFINHVIPGSASLSGDDIFQEGSIIGMIIKLFTWLQLMIFAL